MNNQNEYTEINTKLDSINSKLNIIYKLLTNQSPELPIVNKSQHNVGSDKISKNTINWDMLLTIPDVKGSEIIRGMYNSTYPTVTSGQYDLLCNIAHKYQIDVSV